MKKYLYLLGAGASRNAIPLVSEFPTRLHEFASRLEGIAPKNKYGASGQSLNDTHWGFAREELRKAIIWLEKEASRHASVDTYAKKLFFRGDRDALRRLKAVLSAYLVIEQSQKYVDARYDAFFAHVLELDDDRKIRLPEQMIILTWNYDTQLEKAFYGFCEDENLAIERITFNRNQVYRVNGCCGTNPPGRIGKAFRSTMRTDTSASSWNAGIKLFEEYLSDSSSSETDIRFAWEDSTSSLLNNRLDLPNEISSIIIIGYSFPYFNREIDNQIFKHFYSVEKIYLQYPEGVHATIEERLSGLIPPDTKIIHRKDTETFFIPDDFHKIS
jgi:hypothetical protein